MQEGLVVEKLAVEHYTLHSGEKRNLQYWLACLLVRMIVDDRWIVVDPCVDWWLVAVAFNMCLPTQPSWPCPSSEKIPAKPYQVLIPRRSYHPGAKCSRPVSANAQMVIMVEWV